MHHELASSTAPSVAPRLLGQYGGIGAAMAVRDRAVLDQLQAAGGRRID
ncbi:MAG: hypothetical protein Q8R60_18580 [Mycobacteriales bacterium]|nr:hypothetical protein [Mycobacteriales bacterium]